MHHRLDAKRWVDELMDHVNDLEADPAIAQHLEDIVYLISESHPNGLHLSKRYIIVLLVLIALGLLRKPTSIRYMSFILFI